MGFGLIVTQELRLSDLIFVERPLLVANRNENWAKKEDTQAGSGEGQRLPQRIQ